MIDQSRRSFMTMVGMLGASLGLPAWTARAVPTLEFTKFVWVEPDFDPVAFDAPLIGRELEEFKRATELVRLRKARRQASQSVFQWNGPGGGWS